MPHDQHAAPGLTPHRWIGLSVTPLDLAAIHDFLRCESAGGECLFLGTVRNHNHGRRVEALEYEAYGPMAERMLHVLADHLERTYPLHRIVMIHRTGRLAIGEVAVAVGVSAAHRDAAFQAGREGIDRLKLEIPIWKKEYFAGGEVWVDNCAGCAANAEEYAALLSREG